MGIRSLPATLGPHRAARVACWIMAVPQAIVVTFLTLWDKPLHAIAVLTLLALQIAAMRKLLRDPLANAPWYQGTGIILYVSGMMVAAFALRGLL
jgi:chlorophyll synthase